MIGLMREVIEGRVEGERTRGTPRKGMLEEYLRKRILCLNEEEGNDRESREGWVQWTCPRVEHCL